MGYPPPPHMRGFVSPHEPSHQHPHPGLGGAFGAIPPGAARPPGGHQMPHPLHPSMPPPGGGFPLHLAGARAGPGGGDMWGGGGLYSMGQLGQALGQYPQNLRPTSTPPHSQQQPMRGNHMLPPGAVAKLPICMCALAAHTCTTLHPQP
eukprot:1176554-Prorocentrum_minimum.AAC.4